MRWAVGAVGTTLLTTLVALPAAAAAHGPTTRSSLIPATRLSGAVCVVSGNGPVATPGGSTPVSVPPHPSRVDVVWLPGLNDKACQAVLTRGGGRIASVLATEIDRAPVVAAGHPVNCPMDDGTSARMYFTYGPRDDLRRVDADLSGCSYLSARGAGGRSSTAGFRQALGTLAPGAWRPYVSPTPDPTG